MSAEHKATEAAQNAAECKSYSCSLGSITPREISAQPHLELEQALVPFD